MNDSPDIDPDLEARALECLQRYLAGDLDPSELVFGRPRRAEAPNVAAGITTCRFNIAFHDAQLEYRFGVWPDGKVNQFGIMPVPGDATKASARLAQHFGWPR
jgi:hypothetical protein